MVSNVQILTGAIDNIPISIKSVVEQAISDGNTNAIANLTIGEQVSILTGLYSKYSKQVVFDLLGGWDDDLTSIFLRDSMNVGEFTELIAVDSDPSKNQVDDTITETGMTEPNNIGALFGLHKPKVNTSTIKIEDIKAWGVSVQNDDIRKAFINEGGLINLISQIIGSIMKKAKIYMYGYTQDQLAKMKLKYFIETPFNVEDGETTAKSTLMELYTLAKQMGRPTTKFNEAGFFGSTSYGSRILILDDVNEVGLDVYAFATLFNSDKIAKTKYFKDIYNVAVGNLGQGVIGLICDRDKLREEFYVHEVSEAYNGLKRMVNYFQHNWVKSGYNSALNGFLLVSGAENIEAPTVVNEENKFYAETNFINGKIVYTEDGSNPQATSTAYTEGMTRDPAKDYKFAVVIGDNVGEITTINKD